MKMRRWNKVPVAVLAAFGLCAGMASNSGLASAVGASAAVPTAITAPAQVSLPPVAAEALRMSEAGMSDDVIVSYVQKSVSPYTLDAQQIIYLHDLGVSTAVLNALVENGSTTGNGQPEASGAAATTQSVPSTEAPPVSGAAAEFYSALAPYGTWVNVPAYGWCWQPTVVVINPAWQPYCNNGYWLWSDQGWYWNSYYSWGWAPFHYGRWCRYHGYRWLWCPARTWGPAWVCWRNYPGYCGWAPLPPGAYYTSGIGWTFNGLAVGFNFGFGLGPQCFTFCDYDDFCHPHPYHHFYHGHDADRFYYGSRVYNNFAVDAHHHFINRGVDPSSIEAVTHTRIHPVALREWSYHAGHLHGFAAPKRLAAIGEGHDIYPANRDKFELQNRSASAPRTRWAGYGQRDALTHGFTANRTRIGNVSEFQPSRPNDRQHIAPHISVSRPYQNTFSQHRGGIASFPVERSAPAVNYHRNYYDARRFTPTYHSAPVWHSTPTWHSAPIWHSVPAWHSAPVWHPAPTVRSAPIMHTAPAWHYSAPSRSWGGGAHFGSTRHFSSGAVHFGGNMASSHSFHR